MARPRPGTVGLVRECYSKWERRAPLTPAHVSKLVGQGLRVVVQPCTRRVFADAEYAEAGAVLSEDLVEASAIFGVKQVPAQNLLPGRAYMFFSHVIKAQPENMELLDEVQRQSIRLFDYECVTSGEKPGGQRMVAFGEFAGRAGMIGGLRSIGERALNLGYSTPFLSMGSAYMYPDLGSASNAVKAVGDAIRTTGVPKELAPFTFVFTGNGAASRGAREIFQHLPHTMVAPEELRDLPPDSHQLFGCVAEAQHMAIRKDGQSFDKHDYFEHPNDFAGVFADTIVPHASAIVHCAYWDQRFPRLLTVDQYRHLRSSGNDKLLGVVDISCDIGGAFEMLSRSTHPEAPHYLFDHHTGMSRSDLSGDGLLMSGVDILPSELPREASTHFGEALLEAGIVHELANMDLGSPWSQAKESLSSALSRACISADGQLTDHYKYIEKMRSVAGKATGEMTLQNAASTVLTLNGHLFDSGALNRVLDTLEMEGAAFAIVNMDVAPNRPDEPTKTTAWLQVSVAGGPDQLARLIGKVNQKAVEIPEAQLIVAEQPDYCEGEFSKTLAPLQASHDLPPTDPPFANVKMETSTNATVLVLGAGLVASPAVELLSRQPHRRVIVVSAAEGEANALAARVGRPNVEPYQLDCSDEATIQKYVESSTIALSLLPAPMHGAVVHAGIHHGTPVVTASYISDELHAMSDAAKAAGVPVLGEMGLDPGMDHMSAMKMIDDARSSGGKVVSFRSVCGGLPAPDAANNPLMYKFSWSPRGVLTAALNSAKWLDKGAIQEVDGSQLLSASQPTTAIPTLALESLPNRDSTPYQLAYGLEEAHTVYRGTLRYRGTCDTILALQQLGLLDTATQKVPADWDSLVPQDVLDRYLSTCSSSQKDALIWLQNATTPYTDCGTLHNSKLDALAVLLSQVPELQFSDSERDMCVMQHELQVEYAGILDATTGICQPPVLETIKSHLMLFGDTGVDGDTAMAKTVGLTAAAGVELLLSPSADTEWGLPGGVHMPVSAAVYEPILEILAQEGLAFEETSSVRRL